MAVAARFLHASRPRLFPWLAIAPALLGSLAGVALPMTGGAQEAAPLPPPPAMTVPAGFATAATDHFRHIGAPDGPMDPETFAVAYGPALETALAEAGAVAGVPRERLDVVLFPDGASLEAALAGREERPLTPSPVVADPPVGDLAVALEPLLASSPQEAEADLRHGVALAVARRSAGWNLPRGFGEGFATYAENPSSARLARSAALVQDAYRRDATLTWSDLNRPRAVQGDPDVFAAHAYSVTAFLVERYGLRTYGEFLASLAEEPDWRAAMRSVYQRAPSELEAQWRENLPRWTAGGWRDNLFAGFDLGPARTAIETGRYAAAQRDLERSLRLFTDLGLTENQAAAEPLVRQAERGLQAEALMGQVEQALGRHAYERAAALLEQAEAQYDALPAGLRPDGIIDRYAELADNGLRANASLDEATRLSGSWRTYPEARAAAVDAGSGFAGLGDAAMHDRAAGILNDLDERQRRMTVTLAVLALLSAAWLALWLWVRGPSELDWGP